MKLILQDRDYRLIKELDSCGFLAFNQIATFFFDGNFEAARRRTAKLKDAGYFSITELARVKIIQLTSQASRAFAAERHQKIRVSTKYVNASSIKHELAIRSLKLNLARLNQSDGQFSLKEIIIDQKLLCFKIDQQSFRPDAFANISERTGQQHYFFFEVDMGTESHQRLMGKIKMYERLQKSGEFARWRQWEIKSNPLHSFRVIFVINAKKRARLLGQRLAKLNKQSFISIIECGS